MRLTGRKRKQNPFSILTHPLLIIPFILVSSSGLNAEELTLDRALQIAFKNSPAMRDTILRLEMSEQNLMAQQAGLKSRFDLTITPLRLSSNRVFNDLISTYNTQESTRSQARFSITQPIKWTDGTLRIINQFDWTEASSSYTGSIPRSNFNNSLYLSFEQPLFTYNRTKMDIKELELALENAQLNYAIQRLQIERQVTEQFLNLFYSRQSIMIAMEELKNATESYDIIRSKVDAGISAPEEMWQAEITRDNSRASLENLRIQHENALDNFKILLGMNLSELIDVTADVQKKIVPVDLEKAVSHGMTHRMELRQKDIEIQNAMHDLVRAGAQNEFSASLEVSLGLTGTNEKFPQIYQSPNTDRTFAVSLNIPLWDWGQKKHILAATQAQIDTVKLSAEEERKNIELGIRQAFRSLQNLERQIDIAEKNIQNAERTYDINLERYRNGDLSSKDLQFYQLQLSQQRLSLIQALINYKLSLLDLKIRTLWDFEAQQSLVENM